MMKKRSISELENHTYNLIRDIIWGRSDISSMTNQEQWLKQNQKVVIKVDNFLSTRGGLMTFLNRYKDVAAPADLVYFFVRCITEKKDISEIEESLNVFLDVGLEGNEEVFDTLFEEKYDTLPMFWVVPLIAQNVEEEIPSESLNKSSIDINRMRSFF